MDELSLSRFKHCPKCACWKPATPQFFGVRGKGFHTYCRICNRLVVRDWNKANVERRAEYIKAYCATDAGKAKRRAAAQRWRENNQEAISVYMQTYFANPENKDLQRERCRQWHKDNPEHSRALSNARRARELAAEGAHHPNELAQMYESQQGLCAYCETPLFGSYHVDHMRPLSRGGRNDWTNLAITCPFCNISKGALTVEEFVAR